MPFIFTVIFLITLTTSLLNAAELLSANVYDRSNRTDIMLSLDTPFSGKISMHHQQNIFTLRLTQATTAQSVIKRPQTHYLKTIAISNVVDGLKIVASVTKGTTVKVAKTSDGYGIRLRFIQTTSAPTLTPKESQQPLPTQAPLEISSNYFYVVGALIIMLIALLFLKRFIKSSTTSINKHWFKSIKNEPVTVRFEKQLDKINRVIMIDYDQESYLLLVGSSNILLDKFHENEVVNQNQFDTILADKHDEIHNILQDPSDEPFQIYKEKAAYSYTNE